MSYFRHFGLDREPFGTTPDPEMFYKTLGHEDCYERLKLAIQLQRGLSVIIGDIGYGKTTMQVARRKILLVIDEGQNLSSSQLEILRTFLSFETPTQKLINIVIFAQPEL